MSMDTSTLPVKQWCEDLVAVFGPDSGWRDLFAGSEQLIDASGNE